MEKIEKIKKTFISLDTLISYCIYYFKEPSVSYRFFLLIHIVSVYGCVCVFFFIKC